MVCMFLLSGAFIRRQPSAGIGLAEGCSQFDRSNHALISASRKEYIRSYSKGFPHGRKLEFASHCPLRSLRS
jgi:hypothetical protein